MSVIIKCPSCDKKLKMKEPTPGKKVRCPSCKEPFVPMAAAGSKPARQAAPKKKKRPVPVDEEFEDDTYGDDDYGDDDYEDEPQPKRTAAKGKQKASSKKKKKKAPAKTKSKAPLLIGVSVLAVGLAAGLTYALWPDGEDPAGGGGGEVVDSMGDGDSADQLAPMDPEAGDGSSQAVDLSYLPSKAEAVAKIDVGRLLEGPLGQLLQMPEIAPQVQQFEQMLGMKPQDIESVTIGVGGLTDAIASGKEPNPMQLPLTAVIRTKVALDSTKLQAMIPGAQTVTEGSMTYMRGPSAEVGGAIWFVDSNTVVVGNEPSVKQVGTNPVPPSYVDAALMDGTSPIQIMFSPTNPDAVFRHPKAKLPTQMPVPPAAMAMISNFLANANGAFIGLDLTNDIGVNLSVRCKDSAGATQMVADMKASAAETKAEQANSPPNPMMIPLMGIQKAMEDSQVITASGDICRSTQSAKGGGQTLGAFMPMAMAMIGPAMQQAQQAATRTESRNNLRQIGLAMQNFHSIYQRFPNASSVEESTGKPLLSWRVHLLRFLGHEDLYNRFAIDEPWDSPTNIALVDLMPEVYQDPRISLAPGKTIYMVPVGVGTAFEQQKGRALSEFTDGTSNTVLLVEGEEAVVWTQPADMKFDLQNPKAGLRLSPSGTYQVVLADGSTRPVNAQTDDSQVKAMFTRSGAD